MALEGPQEEAGAKVLECPGISWAVLECLRMCWHLLECPGMFWDVMECSGLLDGPEGLLEALLMSCCLSPKQCLHLRSSYFALRKGDLIPRYGGVQHQPRYLNLGS